MGKLVIPLKSILYRFISRCLATGSTKTGIDQAIDQAVGRSAIGELRHESGHAYTVIIHGRGGGAVQIRKLRALNYREVKVLHTLLSPIKAPLLIEAPPNFEDWFLLYIYISCLLQLRLVLQI